MAAALNLLRYSEVSPVPARYRGIPREERVRRTLAVKKRLGRRLLVLGHNYQNDDVVDVADFVGDSYQLSKIAASADAAEFVAFCGVTFMAETADILTDGAKTVVIPSLEASCPMAGMAENVQVERAHADLSAAAGDDVVPITYINSYADLKAFTAEKGGAICTSANAVQVMAWARQKGKKILFLPDKHLGRNVAPKLGIPDTKIALYNPWKGRLGGLTEDAVRAADLILWEGYCQVHDRFRPEHVLALRDEHPGIRIVVHPECRPEVVELADASGSTSRIQEIVEAAAPGDILGIGTEIHMVRRLARQHPEKTILPLCGDACMDCNAMRQCDPEFLLYVLEELEAGRVANRVKVPDETRVLAKVALQRMLEIA